MKPVAARAAVAAGACALAALTGCGAVRSSESAERLYGEQCASCHGTDGRGAPARRRLEPRLDLSRSVMIANDDSGLVYQRIAFGYNTMPGFSHKLSQGDLEMLADYAMRLAKPAD